MNRRARPGVLLVVLALLGACGSSAAAPAVAPSATDASSSSTAAAPSTTVVASTVPSTTLPSTTVPATTTTTTAPPPYHGPFEVRQTGSLAFLVVSGTVCDLTQPFEVPATFDGEAFVIRFTPDVGVVPAAAGRTGSLAYGFFYASQKETWDVTAEYIVSRPDADGTVHVGYEATVLITGGYRSGKGLTRESFDLVPAPAC